MILMILKGTNTITELSRVQDNDMKRIADSLGSFRDDGSQSRSEHLVPKILDKI